MSDDGALHRTLGTFTLTLYGVGVIVGAGIFVLVGEIVGIAGAGSWLAFLGASVAALPTGLSYAELASRFPKSAGEAVFAERAFGRPVVSFVVGFLVVASGVTSVAAVSHGFAAYLGVLLGLEAIPVIVTVVAFLAVLSFVNDRGIRESTWVNATCAIVSVLALLVLAGAAIFAAGDGTSPQVDLWEVTPTAMLPAVALAFYAFIGFEDICNMAEETREPSRTVPRAILWSLLISTLLYVAVTVAALSVLGVDALAGHPTPMALLSERVFPGLSTRWLAAVALLAVTNTALLNLVMVSRVVFGMARAGWLPAPLGVVHPRTRTPRRGVLLAFGLTVALASTGVLGILAKATNVVILLAFLGVNVSLVVVRYKRVEPDPESGEPFRTPIFVPVLGVATTLVLLTQLPAAAYLRAGGLVALGIVLHLMVGPGRARAGGATP